MGLGKSNGGIGGLKPYNKNKNWNRLIKIYFNKKNKIIRINIINKNDKNKYIIIKLQ